MNPAKFVRLALLPGALLCSGAAFAAPPASSPYSTDVQNSHVEDATSEGVGQVNMIACIMAAMRPEAFVNQGAYNALVNEAKCEPSGSADAAASGDAAQAPKYMTATVNATRASNSDPMISKIWIVQEEEGKQTFIDVHVSATAAPTPSNPYGSFQLFFCGHEPASTTCRMNGFLEGSDAGVRYFQTETRDDGNGLETSNTALKLSASGTSSGGGRMQMDRGSQSSVFNFAYNASLYVRDDGNDTQCFSRDASDPETGMSVWRYGLYDATTGERISRNSGFPIDFSSGGQTWHGYLGYSGLSLPSAAMDALHSGDTVQKVDYSGQGATKTNYTVVKAGGRLLKFTRQQRTLAAMDRIKFTAFVGSNVAGFFSGAVPNTQYEMYWDDASGNFKVTGRMNCGPNGCQTIALANEQPVSVAFWQGQAGIQGWSNSLGGELFIKLQGVASVANSGDVAVTYRTQDLVYPADLPTNLYCVRDCANSGTIAAYFAPGSAVNSPFTSASANNFNPTPLANVEAYHTDPATALLLDAGSQPVTLTDPAAAQQRPQYQYGLRTGRLVADLSVVECAPNTGTFCDWKINDQEVYYQWETGPGSFNQFAAVKDSNGHFVAFDAPLQVAFHVPSGVRYGEFAGQSLVLQYGGYGDLWGIPGHCVSRYTNEAVECNGNDARYVPAFVIPYDVEAGRVTNGTTAYLVKWLDREIRFAKKAPASCAAAQLVAPTGVQLPTSAVLKSPSDPNSDVYVGVKPVVTSAPRVIHGEVKY